MAVAVRSLLAAKPLRSAVACVRVVIGIAGAGDECGPSVWAFGQVGYDAMLDVDVYGADWVSSDWG